MTQTDFSLLSEQLPYLSDTIQLFESLKKQHADYDLAPQFSNNVRRLANQSESRWMIQYSALEAARSSTTKTFLNRFFKDEDDGKIDIGDVKKSYKAAKSTIENYSDIVELVLGGGQPLPTSDVRLHLFNYIINGKCTTRLGEVIEMPAEDRDDWSLLSLLGISRILIEGLYAGDLPWLAEDDTPSAQRYKKLELQAGELGNKFGSTIGRATGIAAASVFNPILKVPDEIIVGFSYITGAIARKEAEGIMHRFLTENPNVE